MAIELVIRPRPSALESLSSTRANAILEGFFAFDARQRTFLDPAALADCAFFDLCISYYVRDWPGQKHHPGIFEEFFPLILERLIAPENILTLFINDWEGGYFEPKEHVENQLRPRGLSHVFVPDRNIVSPGSQDRPQHLVFEWPADSLSFILEEHWLYYGPFIETEGYVSKGSVLDKITQLYSQPDTEQRIREMLRATEFCFRVWPDGDGMLLLTDKLNLDAPKRRLRLHELNPLIREAAQGWDKEP
jgi:hypothetical protein